MVDPKSNKKSYNPDHDPYFKVGMSYRQVAIPFLKDHLRAKVQAMIDLDKLQLESENLVAQALKRKIVDVLFSVPYKDDETAYIYILAEQQHKAERFMPFRLLLYIMLVIERILRKMEAEQKKARKAGEETEPIRHLPTVIPVVYYTGEESYKQPLRLLDLFKEPEQMKGLFLNDMPLIEAAKVNTDQLEDPWDRVFQGLFAHFNDPEIGKILLQLKHDFVAIEKSPGGDEFLNHSIHYLLKSSRHLAEEDVRALSQEMDKLGVGGSFMTIMERWEHERATFESERATFESEKATFESEKETMRRNFEKREAELLRKKQEEKAELLREQKEETARHLLKLGLEFDGISQVTGFTKAKIEEIQRKMKTSS